MDNVAKHRFWILFGVTVLLAPVGWWLGTANLVAETEKQLSAIAAAENSVDSILNEPHHPNRPKFIEPLQKVNQKRAEHHQQGARYLWEQQKDVMQWPKPVAPVMENTPFMQAGDETTDREANIRTEYANIYDEECRRVRDLVDPVRFVAVQDDDGQIIEKPVGKVWFEYQGYPRPRLPSDAWRNRSPAFEEMWETQLDNWLIAAILKSVNRVNEYRGAKNVYDASIRRIVSLVLRGGSRNQPNAKTASGEDAEGAPPGEGEGEGEAQGATGSKSIPGLDGRLGSGEPGGETTRRMAGTEAGGRSSDSGGLPAKDIGDIVFGQRVPKQVPGENGDSPPGGEDGSAAGASYPGSTSSGDNSERTGGGSFATMSPWVDNDPEMPFKTRGFIIQVLMKRKDIPLLVRELTDARKTKFPVEILWINTLDKDLDHKGERVIAEYRSRRTERGEQIGGGPDDNRRPRLGIGSPRTNRDRDRFNPVPGRRSNLRNLSGEDDGSGGRGVQSNAALQAAFDEPGLSYVLIAGVLTIYMPPEEVVNQAERSAAGSSSQSTPGQTTPDGAPADNTTDNGNTADGTTPSDKTNTSGNNGESPTIPPPNSLTPPPKNAPKTPPTDPPKTSPAKNTPQTKSKNKKTTTTAAGTNNASILSSTSRRKDGIVPLTGAPGLPAARTGYAAGAGKKPACHPWRAMSAATRFDWPQDLWTAAEFNKKTNTDPDNGLPTDLPLSRSVS